MPVRAAPALEELLSEVLDVLEGTVDKVDILRLSVFVSADAFPVHDAVLPAALIGRSCGSPDERASPVPLVVLELAFVRVAVVVEELAFAVHEPRTPVAFVHLSAFPGEDAEALELVVLVVAEVARAVAEGVRACRYAGIP